MGRRHSMTGGAPLAPIYEHEGSRALGSFGDESAPKIQDESQFQIITDNASSYSDFLSNNRKLPPTQSLGSLSPSKKLHGEGRWGNGDATKISKDSNSSISTNSTSSLTVSIFDAEDYSCVEDFFEEPGKMSSTEIIKQATDLVAGKYGYNIGDKLNSRSSTRRPKARRSSLPTMPIRQESIENINVTSEALPLSPVVSTLAVGVDKFGIPICTNKSSHDRRTQKERRPSLPKSPDANPNESASIYDYSPASPSMKVDKFGIPVQEISSNSRRRRQARRSSLGDYPTNAQPSQPLVDKYGIPITSNPPLESRSTHTHTSRMRRRRGRSSLGDSPSVPFEALSVDKFGIPISRKPLKSSSDHSNRRERRRSDPESRKNRPVRRSSDPASDAQVDKFGIPIPSAFCNDSPSKRRQGRRSSMPTKSVSFDLPPSPSSEEEKKEDSFHLQSSVSIPVDEFGIPVWPKDFDSKNGGGRRIRQEGRSSIPTFEKSSISSSSAQNRCARRGRRPSIPSHSSSAMRFSSEELPISNRKRSDSADKNGASQTANVAPIRPERVPSVDNFGSQNAKTITVAQPNASFDVVKQPHKKGSNKLESIVCETLDHVLDKSERTVLKSDLSVNSMQQKDGEWWW